MIINSLVIPVTPEIVTAYDLDSPSTTGRCSIFSGNNLVLPVLPGSYRRTTSGSVERKDGYSSARYLVESRLIGFECDITDGRLEIEDVLNELMQTATGGGASILTPITVLDYVRPERVDRATGYTTRTGIFKRIEPKAGTVRESSDVDSRRWSEGGFTLEFEERTRRSTW